MSIAKVTVIPASELPSHIKGMNDSMRQWTDSAARGECGWVCSGLLLLRSEGDAR
ncbi:hypothetical protein AAAC07_13065 [Pseudomonas aeruginosa]